MGAGSGFRALTQVEQGKDGVGMEMGVRVEIVMKIRVRMGPGMELETEMKMRKDGTRDWVGTELTWDRCSALGNHCQGMLAEGQSTSPTHEWNIHSGSGFPGL